MKEFFTEVLVAKVQAIVLWFQDRWEAFKYLNIKLFKYFKRSIVDSAILLATIVFFVLGATTQLDVWGFLAIIIPYIVYSVYRLGNAVDKIKSGE